MADYKRTLQGLCFITCICSGTVQAGDLQIRGFSDLIASKSSTDLPVGTINNNGKRLTVDSESDLGLNLSADLGNKITFASQILANGKGGAYRLFADWLFATYRPTDGWAIRVGRQINPQFLYSEQYAVGYTYLWTRLPSEVYGLNPIDSFNGLSIIYTVPLAGDFQLKTQLYGGAGDTQGSGPFYTYSAALDDDKGIELTLSSDRIKIRAGYNTTNPKVSESIQTPVLPGNPVLGTIALNENIGSIQSFTAGTSLEWRDFELLSEMVRLTGTGDFIRTATGVYGTLGYHLLPSITPYFTYAWEGDLSGIAYTFPDPTVSTTRLTDEHGITFGLNFKVSPSAIVKTEYMRTEEHFVDTSRNFGANTFTAAFDFIF